MIWIFTIAAVLALIWWVGARLNRYPPLDPELRARRSHSGSVSDSRSGLTTPHTEASLMADLHAWRARHGYRDVGPHELLMDPTLTPEQFGWLRDFVKVWDGMTMRPGSAP